MSAYLPGPDIDFEVSLAIVGSGTPGAWDVGSFDFSTWYDADTPLGDWVDFTCDVADGPSFGAGSSPDGVVTRWEAQTFAFTLCGSQYDPNTGPYRETFGPALPVRVRWKPHASADWLTAFVGQVDDDGFTYDPKTERATVAATDATRVFANYDGTEQNPQGAGETAAARVARIADMVGWAADARDITPGGVALQATTLADVAWTMLLQVADTDLALLWINRAGQLAYRPEGKVTPGTVLDALVTCDEADAPAGNTLITPVNITGQQPTLTRNVVSISRQSRDENDDPVTFTARDDSSVARFFAHAYQRTDLVHNDDDWSTTVAEAILLSSAWPTHAPATLELSSRADPAATALLLGLEPSLAIGVLFNGVTFTCEPAAWSVTVKRSEVSGSIDLVDVTEWVGGGWDIDGWDLTRWGF